MTKRVYKIKSSYNTIIVESEEFDLFSGQDIYVLSDKTKIPAKIVDQLFRLVDGTIGESGVKPTENYVPKQLYEAPIGSEGIKLIDITDNPIDIKQK